VTGLARRERWAKKIAQTRQDSAFEASENLMQRIPSNDSAVQGRQTTERVELIAELASPQRALLAKAEESRQVVRSLTLVKFAAHWSAIFLGIQSS
jgi:hypothetical protein